MKEERIAKGGIITLAFLIVVGVYMLAYHPPSLAKLAVAAPEIFAPHLVGTTTQPSLSAEAHFLAYVGVDGKETVLSASNEHLPLPIASVTKLMTSYVAFKIYKTTDDITLTRDVLTGKGRSGVYTAGTTLSFTDALHALLIPSHNDIADALAFSSSGGTETFIGRMNTYAHLLGLSETAYINPTGLDPNRLSDPVNHSSAYDTYRVLRDVKEQMPALFSITSKQAYELFDIHNAHIASLVTTNEMLDETIGQFRVLGGKTGETPRAKQALVIAASTPCGGILYATVLRSDDRFADMRALLAYASEAFDWHCEKDAVR